MRAGSKRQSYELANLISRNVVLMNTALIAGARLGLRYHQFLQKPVGRVFVRRITTFKFLDAKVNGFQFQEPLNDESA